MSSERLFGSGLGCRGGLHRRDCCPFLSCPCLRWGRGRSDSVPCGRIFIGDTKNGFSYTNSLILRFAGLGAMRPSRGLALLRRFRYLNLKREMSLNLANLSEFHKTTPKLL